MTPVYQAAPTQQPPSYQQAFPASQQRQQGTKKKNAFFGFSRV
jgi:hypothetical protein